MRDAKKYTYVVDSVGFEKVHASDEYRIAVDHLRPIQLLLFRLTKRHNVNRTIDQVAVRRQSLRAPSNMVYLGVCARVNKHTFE